jgi:FtsP/CotA-like multicopper oxidase with cupredoxin domain
MRASRLALLVAVTAAVLVVQPASAPSAPQVVTFDLCAKAGTVTLPGGVTAPIWGFAEKPAGTPCTDAGVTPTLPGPQLTAGVGDTVTLNVTNALDAGHTISLEAPGIGFDPGGSADAGPGDTASRTFTASAAGTYLYASAGGAGRQQAMGLYGALVVRPDITTGYDRERTLVLSEIDPALNADPDGFNMLNWAPSYWLINGRAHPQTAELDVHAGDRLLVRYVNAGLEHVTMTLLGRDMRVVARDAYPLANPIDVVAQTIPAGATADGIVTIPASASAGDGYPLYNRQLRLTNGAPGAPDHSPGGMLTFIRVVP